MRSLKSSLILTCFGFLLSACQSMQDFRLETFPESKSKNEMHIIYVKSDRVRQQCAFLNAEAENNWRHQYFLYVLNDKSEVMQVIQPTHQDKVTCYDQMKKIEKLLQSEQRLRLCARDRLKHEIEQRSINFGPLGQHKISYEALTFDSICNSKKCFSNNEVWVNTCPGFKKN